MYFQSVLSMAGEIYVQLQQWPQAENSILSALAVSPHHVGTHVTLAQILARNVSKQGDTSHFWNGKVIAYASQVCCYISFNSLSWENVNMVVQMLLGCNETP